MAEDNRVQLIHEVLKEVQAAMKRKGVERQSCFTPNLSPRARRLNMEHYALQKLSWAILGDKEGGR